MARTYRQGHRARSQAETRLKIVNAAIELHQAKGLAATSMRDVAERAGVGTVTVYRHFPDDMALLGACSGSYFERHPLPDPQAWRSIADPEARLRHGLMETYRYHRETEPMIASVIHDARDMPVIEPYTAHWQRAAANLAEAWPEEERQDGKLGAALALALRFETWQLLTQDHGLSDEQAVDLMMRLACDRHRKTRREPQDRTAP